jgi:hypothetical protein
MTIENSRNKLGIVALLILIAFGCAVAQNPPSIEEMKRSKGEAKRIDALSEGTFKLLWSKMNVELHKVVKGSPYSAVAVSEHTQTLTDGNQIVKRSESVYYRDNEGRVRIERRLDNIGNWRAAGEPPPRVIMISDPVAGRSYTLDPVTLTARVDAYGSAAELDTKNRRLLSAGVTGEKTLDNSDRIVTDPVRLKMLEEKLAAKKKQPTDLDADFNRSAKNGETNKPPSDQRVKKESLGTQVIEGVTVEGTRVTQTIPAGEIGNTLPIHIVDENWYSPELQLRVMTKHSDPRSGESIFRLTNINRSAPSPSLFEVPAGYTIIESQEKRSDRRAISTKR